MTKEASSTTQPVSDSRLRNFTRVERESGLHPAVRALHSRPAERSSEINHRAIQYARIQRGWQA